MPWFTIKAQADSASAQISILEPIGSWDLTAASFIDQVKSLGNVSQINLDINSPGGDVFEAITIFNYLKRHPASVNVTVLGVAASAASLIAMAGDSINMPANAMMMIHNPWTFAVGNSDDLRAQADMLDKVGGSLFATYQARTGMDEAELKAMLATDTWMTAQECLTNGFCDSVTDAISVKASFDVSKFPEQAQAIFAAAAIAATTPNDAPEDEAVLAPETPQTDLDDDENIEEIIEEAVNNSLDYSAGVVELCALAGMGDKAAGFIKAKTSLDDVRAELVKAKANQQPIITHQSTPLAMASMPAPHAVYAKRNKTHLGA